MFSRTATVTLALSLMLSGCATTDYLTRVKTQHRTVTKAEVVEVEVKTYVELPAELLIECPVTKGTSRKVKEYVRVANTNTPALEQCARQIEEIRKLQPKP